MDTVYEFTDDPRLFSPLGGTDRKFSVSHDGVPYMLKFTDTHAKRTDMSTSYVNNVTSEYICSHISASTGLPTHETLIGTYNGELVVACRDETERPSFVASVSDIISGLGLEIDMFTVREQKSIQRMRRQNDIEL